MTTNDKRLLEQKTLALSELLGIDIQKLDQRLRPEHKLKRSKLVKNILMLTLDENRRKRLKVNNVTFLNCSYEDIITKANVLICIPASDHRQMRYYKKNYVVFRGPKGDNHLYPAEWDNHFRYRHCANGHVIKINFFIDPACLGQEVVADVVTIKKEIDYDTGTEGIVIDVSGCSPKEDYSAELKIEEGKIPKIKELEFSLE